MNGRKEIQQEIDKIKKIKLRFEHQNQIKENKKLKTGQEAKINEEQKNGGT